MNRRVLVAYASRHGSTAAVAVEIGTAIADAGAYVDVVPAAKVDSLAGYDLVILGGALYVGRWHKDAIGFLKRHCDELVSVPLAVYAMGPKTLEADDVALSRRQLDDALDRLPVVPFAATIFGGVVDPAKLRFPFSRLAPVDARDHAQISAWTREVLSVPSPSQV